LGVSIIAKQSLLFPLTSTSSQSPFCVPKKGLIIIIIIKVLFDHNQSFVGSSSSSKSCLIIIRVLLDHHHHLLLRHHSSLIYSFHSHSTKQSLNRKKQEEDFKRLCSFKGILFCQDHAVVFVAVLSLKGRSIADKWILRR
jgi:hypothetical protein